VRFAVRDGSFDVVVVAGPRVDPWPSSGVRALSSLCAEMGLEVGVIGGDGLTARGVLPLPGTGGLVFAQDAQNRIHRFHARAVVRITAHSQFPDPFPGWRSQGILPLATALRLQSQAEVEWSPCTVVLGTGNRALRFASSLLESGVPEVYCVESWAQWGAKRFAGWEVERRRFEMGGGKLIEARPVSLTAKSALLWELRLEDAQGIRVIEVSRVIAGGPFRDSPGVREYPPGSFLFELEQTASASLSENVEGWILEEERGRWLAVKIIRALVTELGPRREELERVLKRTRARLKRYDRHREQPFTPTYQGKWTSTADARAMRTFSGVPQAAQKFRPVASIECFEEIGCNLCQRVCPKLAIDLSRKKGLVLSELDCTACGDCLPACPSSATFLIHERENSPTSQITLTWRGAKPWKVGEFATLVNRRGDSLGSGRVSGVQEVTSGAPRASQVVQVDVPQHLLWEARQLKRGRVAQQQSAEAFVSELKQTRANEEKKIEITLNGEKRLVRDRIPVTVALYEIGQGRPEDALFCSDGSCGLCQIDVDGAKKLACQTPVHKGMAIRGDFKSDVENDASLLCPCMAVQRQEVIDRVEQGSLRSPESVISITHVGEGRCHGQLCMDSFRRLLLAEGLDASQWIDWRFPWSDWVLAPGPQA
jgi:ferredoxin